MPKAGAAGAAVSSPTAFNLVVGMLHQSCRPLACCRFRGHRDWVFHEGGGGRCNDENLLESSRSRQFG
jgi:hypothetical protein